MKVLMLTPSYDPIIGGTEYVVKSLATKLNEIGVQTDVITFNMDEKWNPVWKKEIKEENGFKVYRIPAFNPFKFKKVPNPFGMFLNINVIPKPGFKNMLEEYDILHFHDDADLTLPFFSYFVKKPKLFHCHSLNVTHHNYKSKTMILGKHIFKRISDLYVCGCKSVSDLLLDIGISEERIRMIRYAVDTDKYKPDKDTNVDNLILFASRIEPSKGLHILLQSLQYLNIPIQLAILGIETKSSYSNQIKEMIDKEKKKGVHEIMYTTTVHGDGLISWYQKASIFVCPSTIDVFPTINPQALACGTPIVASKVGGIPEIVQNEVTGLLVPPGNPVELARAMERLLEEGDLRRKCGRQGRALIEREFSLDMVAKRLCGIYEEMSSGGAR